MSTPNHVSVVCEIESFFYVIIPTPVSIIPLKGDF